jgi:Tol biopolymer transport system component
VKSPVLTADICWEIEMTGQYKSRFACECYRIAGLRNMCIAENISITCLLTGLSWVAALPQTKTLSEATLANEQPTHALTSDLHFDDEHPSVAPDGKHIVFSRQQLEPKNKPRLWVMDIDGSEAHPLTPREFALECDYPAWSPAGSVIAFRAGPDTNSGGIWLIGADGKNIRRLTDEKKSDDMYPTWSPDGSWMVISRGPTTQEPTTVDNSEENARPFTSLGGAALAWSPDGKWIAFTSNRERGYAVYLSRAIGGPAIRVTAPASADKNHPSWTPDGKTIMFEQYDATEHAHILSVDVSKIVGIP